MKRDAHEIFSRIINFGGRAKTTKKQMFIKISVFTNRFFVADCNRE